MMDAHELDETLKLLVVDDRRENLIAMKAALRDLGVEIVTAQSGAEALSLMLRHRFAVVLLDVQMPDLNGFELAALMRDHDDTKAIPIIFVTAINKEESYVFQGYESGAVDYLFKPVDPRILRSKVKVFLDLYRSQVDLQRTFRELERANACLDDFAFALSGLLTPVREFPCHAGVSQAPLMLDPEEMIRRAHTVLSQLASDPGDKKRRTAASGTQVRFLDRYYEIHNVRPPVLRALVSSLEELAQMGRHVVQAYSQLKEEVEERKNAERAALAAGEAKARFLQHMSHEFRTPLNAIIGLGEILKWHASGKQLDDSFHEELDSIMRAGHYLLELVNEILDFASIESNHVTIDLERIDIYELVHEIYVLLTPLARKQCNRLLIDCKPTIGSMITDRLKLRQILNNLLGNACKFTSGGEVSIRVRRERGVGGEAVVFCVADTGIGIEPHRQRVIFEEFKQAAEYNTREHSGAGLGLAITERYCRMLSGSIDVTSAPGKGSVFTVRLPAVQLLTTELHPATKAI